MLSICLSIIIPITSMASGHDKNKVASSAIYGSRINMSIDQKSVKYSPQYFNPNKLYSSRFTSLAAIPGLPMEELLAARQVISKLQDMDFSNEMIAGILGNLKIESDFRPDAGSKSSHYGLVQWGDNRMRELNTIADAETISGQMDFLKAELLGTPPASSNYGVRVNGYLSKFCGGASMQTVDDVDMATEAFCVVVEGCIKTAKYKNACGKAANGNSYQMLDERKTWANKFYSYLSKGGVAGSISGLEGMTNPQMLQTIFGVSSGNTFTEIMYGLGFNDPHSASQENRMESTYLTTGVYTTCGKKRTFVVNKFIADDAQEALQALSDKMGERGASLSVGGYCFRKVANSSNWSFHASGLAFDCNDGTNPCKKIGHDPALDSDVSALLRSSTVSGAETGGIYNPDTQTTSIRASDAEEMISRGFLWGRDFSNKADMMHFSVAEVSLNGRNRALTDHFSNK